MPPENPRLPVNEEPPAKREVAERFEFARSAELAANEPLNELCIVESDCDLGTIFRATGAFSWISPPWPEKLRTVPVDPVPRFPLKTWKPPAFVEGPDPDGAPDGPRAPDGPPKECHCPPATEGAAEEEF